MNKFMRAAVLALAGSLGLAGSASAIPVQWTFDASPAIRGSFVYDADTNTYSNISVSTIRAGGLWGHNYTDPFVTPRSSASRVEFQDIPYSLELAFGSALSNLGGTGISVRLEELNRSVWDRDDVDMDRNGSATISGKPVVDSTVPLPAAGGLFLAGLVAMAGVGRRKRRHQG